LNAEDLFSFEVQVDNVFSGRRVRPIQSKSKAVLYRVQLNIGPVNHDSQSDSEQKQNEHKGERIAQAVIAAN